MKKSSVVGIFVIILSLVAGLSAQTNQGRITGRVTDPTGAILPNAKVTITNTETGVARVLTTSDAGDFFAPNLPPGVYSVSAEAQGFQKMVRSSVRLEVASAVRLDFAMKPGAVAETIEVTGQQELINTVSDTLGGTLTNQAINELPLQGRDFQNLLMLRPGVQRTPGGGMLSITSNGLRTTQNNFMVDGADSNDIYYVTPLSTAPASWAHRPVTCLWTQSRNSMTSRTRVPSSAGSRVRS